MYWINQRKNGQTITPDRRTKGIFYVFKSKLNTVGNVHRVWNAHTYLADSFRFQQMIQFRIRNKVHRTHTYTSGRSHPTNTRILRNIAKKQIKVRAKSTRNNTSRNKTMKQEEKKPPRTHKTHKTTSLNE